MHVCLAKYAMCSTRTVITKSGLPSLCPAATSLAAAAGLTLKLGCGCYLFCSAVLYLYATRRQRLITPPSPFSSLYCAPTHFHSPHISRYILLSPFWTGTIAHSSTSMSFFGSSDSTRWGGLLKQAISNVETTFDSLLEQQNNEQAQQQQQRQQQTQTSRRGWYGE